MTDLAITGYPSSWRGPIAAAEIVFNQGPSTAGTPGRVALFCGPKLSNGSPTGSWTANTTYRVYSEQEASDGAGAGSPLHRMIRMYMKANKGGIVYALPYNETSVSTNVAANMTVVVSFSSGSNPTATTGARIWLCGERVGLTFLTTDTATTIGDQIAAAVNNRTYLPFTAANVTGTVTLTAKVDGTSQGDGTVGILKVHGEVDAGANTVLTFQAAALGLGAGVDGAEGTTTESANLTTALATIDAALYDYMGFSVWSSAHTAVIETHVQNKSQPKPGKRSLAVIAYTGTTANATTVAIARNAERVLMVHQPNSEHDPAELVGNMVAVLQKREPPNKDGGFVRDFYRESDWLILPAYANADWPNEDVINDAITDGISIISSDQTGSSLVMCVDTRSKDSAGTLDDFRSTERHRVSYMDLFVAEILQNYVKDFGDRKLTDDPVDVNGKVDLNQVILLQPEMLCPQRLRKWLAARIEAFGTGPGGRAMFQKTQDWIDSMQVRIDPQNSSRIQASVSGRTVDIAHQFTLKLNETSPG